MKKPLRRFKFTDQETGDLIIALETTLSSARSLACSLEEQARYERLITKLSEPKSLGYARSIIKRAIKNKGGKVSDYKSEAIEEAARNLMEGKDDE